MMTRRVFLGMAGVAGAGLWLGVPGLAQAAVSRETKVMLGTFVDVSVAGVSSMQASDALGLAFAEASRLGAGVQPARRRPAGERAEPCGPSAGRARRIGTGGEPVAVLRRTDGREFRCDGAAGDRSLPGTPQSLRRADAGRFGASGGPRAGGPPGTSGFGSGSVLCAFGYGHHAGRHRQGVYCGPGFRRADVRRGEVTIS